MYVRFAAKRATLVTNAFVSAKARVAVQTTERSARETLVGFVHEKRELDPFTRLSVPHHPVKDIYWTMMVPCMPAPWWGSQ